jgi:D-beta-D-heptose 7-phosphate kinase/D-beta-D-heptose 1-phosphate adenosyltransferase
LQPDVLVKGGDYTLEKIVGAKEVIANGGRVVINPIVAGFSTTGIVEKIKKYLS